MCQKPNLHRRCHKVLVLHNLSKRLELLRSSVDLYGLHIDIAGDVSMAGKGRQGTGMRLPLDHDQLIGSGLLVNLTLQLILERIWLIGLDPFGVIAEEFYDLNNLSELNFIKG